MAEELLTVKEVAARLKLNPQTVRRWIRSGRLPAVQIAPHRYRVRESDLAADLILAHAARTPQRRGEYRSETDRAPRLAEEVRESAGVTLQDILDEDKCETELRGARLRPPEVSPERIELHGRILERLLAMRAEFSHPGPTLQEILDAERQEQEG